MEDKIQEGAELRAGWSLFSSGEMSACGGVVREGVIGWLSCRSGFLCVAHRPCRQ